MFTIYHNARCSKSRGALELLEQHGQTPEIVFYLETPPTATTLKKLHKQLGIPMRDMMRSSEAEYKALNLANPALSETDLISAMVEHPKLIERPIVTDGKRAVIARPPEKVLELLA